MENPLLLITDKVTRMIRSMVYLAMWIGYRRGATTNDIVGFLRVWAPSDRDRFHTGAIERALVELNLRGKVVNAGGRWYLAEVPC